MAERPIDEATFDTLERLSDFADQRGRSLLELAFAGLLARPVVSSVIAGATKVEQVTGNVAAGEWGLDADDIVALAEVLDGDKAGDH
jgi:aryl-alcohol dehydrogenase-like predicted oxidoreductase